MGEKKYICLYCKSKITKEKYDKIVRENGILKKKLESLEKEREEFKIKEKKFREDEKNFDKKLKEEVKQARIHERIKQGNELSKAHFIIRKLKENIENLKKGKTAQELGFDFENEMYDLLKAEFPHDEVEHTGKKGDVLIKIKAKGKIIGIILIECKRTEKHKPEHIEEVKRHKIAAKADVGVLVTNGDFGKKKMDGFKNIEDILIIRPFSAIDFIKLLREHIVYTNSLKISKEEKNKKMLKLWEFIHSAGFESQMNSILRDINRFKDLDTKESDLLDKRTQIEENLLKAHNLIMEGVYSSKKEE